MVVQEEMLSNGKAEALRSFTGYQFQDWSSTRLDGMVIYTQ